MARADTIVLGAGMVGTSVAVHLAKRGVAVALVDRGGRLSRFNSRFGNMSFAKGKK